jgi:DNA-binding PadR family transcriptional regulator
MASPKTNDDPQAFLPLRTNWFHILLSLAADEQHGYGIMQEVLDRTGGKVHLWPATLYGTLARLIDAGLIQESEERPAEELDDARRRYYKLTRLGRRVLDLESQRLEELVNVLRAKRRQVKRRQEAYE